MAVRIKEQRKLKGFTQAEVAERVGVTASYLSKIEAGEQTPQLNTFFDLILKGLRMTVAEFFQPWLRQEDPDSPVMEAESNALFSKYAYDERTRRSVWDFLKFIDETYSRRRLRK